MLGKLPDAITCLSMTRHPKGASGKLAPFFIAACLILNFSPALSQAAAPVVDIQDREASTPVRAGSAPATPALANQALANNANAPVASRRDQFSDLFVQVQELQHEVQDLRGIIEQQNFEIQSLKQQTKDNYIDLDKRLAALQSTTTAPPAPSSPAIAAPAATVPDTTTAATTPLPASGAEKDSYDAAYKLLDQNKKDEAADAFRKHLSLYPKGDYAANADYWLGQIYLTQGQLAQAEQQFNALLKDFPDHRKVPDAKFALGKVYFQEGKKAEAQKIIQEVAQGNSKTAELAKSFLQDNF